MRSASEHGVARVFMISNWCLTASDSAATVPGPRGLASFAKVTSRSAIKMNSSRMKANFNRSAKDPPTARLTLFLSAKLTIRHRQL